MMITITTTRRRRHHHFVASAVTAAAAAFPAVVFVVASCCFCRKAGVDRQAPTIYALLQCGGRRSSLHRDDSDMW
jgi:hypothetical protein